MNKILNLSFLNYSSNINIFEEKFSFKNLQGLNFFSKNLFILFNGILKINNLNFQNFEFSLFFDIKDKKKVDFSNINLLKKNKVHFKFLKKIINLYLNFIFIKNNSFLKNLKFNFFRLKDFF